MKFEGPLQSQPQSAEKQQKTAEAGRGIGAQKHERPLSPGEIKVNEYVSRILGGESKDSIFQGLPESFRNGIEDKLAQLNEEDERGIPPQYRGLDSELLEAMWTIPEYVDRNKTKALKEKKAKAVAALRERELSETAKKERQTTDEQKIAELRQQLGIEKPPESPAATAKTETPSPSAETGSLSIEERKKLSGWSASYELAKVAKQQGIDLSTLSREEYVDYAIQNFLAIDDSQLRMPPWQRMCESVKEIVTKNKEKRAAIKKEADEAFNKFRFEIQKKAGEDDRSIQDRIRVRQGTKDSNSWLFFKVNSGTAEGSKETYKSYVSVKDLNKLTPERFTSLMAALRDAGYNGDIKIFQDLAMQGVNLNDQIVMHGASENDARLALAVAEKFFGDDLDQKSVGKDEVVDGKNHSYSEILAKKIKDAINPPKNP
jgi:hypothetical protein